MSDHCLITSACEMRPLEDFLPEVMINAPGITPEIAASYIRDAAIDLCERSKVVRQKLCVDIQACVQDVTLEPMCGMRIVAIHKICPTAACNSGYNITSSEPCWSMSNGASVWFVPPDSLRLDTNPDVDREEAFWVLVSVAPDRDACELPEEMYRRYRKAITAGALTQLHLIKGSEAFDTQLSDRRKKEFDAGISGAAMDRLTGYSMGPFKVRPRTRIV